jgi:hypothetical protein
LKEEAEGYEVFTKVGIDVSKEKRASIIMVEYTV